jgi:Zn-dependent oligopeptidase
VPASFLQVLAVILNLRQQLATEHAAASYADLILSGSCLGSASSAASLLTQLQPVLSQHAAAELAQVSQLAVRRARAAGRWVDAAAGLDTWDLAYIAQDVVSGT